MRFEEWKMLSLSDICEYGCERIDIAKINKDNYISTENMNPNRGGVNIANCLPKVKTVLKYSKGDVLISNIRPYFKKIWFADKNGGSSNDVLVIKNKSKKQLDNKFLYYCLSKDDFFDYVTATSKGTKMPRGDKDAIMKYTLEIPPLEEQKAIANIFSALDEKIEINNRINKILEEMAQAIFKHWFIDFEFPNEDGEPYKSSGGEMVESELGFIPKGWKITKLERLGEFKNGINYSRKEMGDSVFKIVNVRDLIGTDFIVQENLSTINIDNKKAINYFLKKGDLLIVRSAKPGEIGIILNSDCNIVFSGFIIRFRLFQELQLIYIYCTLKGIKEKLNLYSNGTTLQNINQEILKNIKIIVPSDDILFKYNMIISTIIDKIAILNNETLKLLEIRNDLLPKLMSGEIRVPLDD